jgi:hypothetical protein
MVAEIIEELDLYSVYSSQKARDGDTFINIEGLLSSPTMGNPRGPQRIIFVDEIQNIFPKERPGPITTLLEKTSRDLVESSRIADPEEFRRLQNRLSDTLSSLERAIYSDVPSLRTKSISEHLLWHLTGNGVTSLSPPLSTHQLGQF